MANERPTYKKWLFPISLLYGMGVNIRNLLFDWNILKSKSYAIPIICVGTITVGGTGKTPHIEYLVNLLLREKFNIAILSRGYKRKTTGYVLAKESSTAKEIGDEPYQMKMKFPQVTVAVDEDRRHGIKKLLKIDNPHIDVILLDDAYQHRRVKAGLNILLTDHDRLFTEDLLLPAGRLREPAHEKERAHIVVVTKCPSKLKPIDFHILGKKLNLYPYQGLFFSQIAYESLRPLYPDKASSHAFHAEENVLLLTGIASPAPLIEEVSKQVKHVEHLTFADHHDYKKKDIHHIEKVFRQMAGEQKIIVTTEKDAARLLGKVQFSEDTKPFVYVLPMGIQILQDRETAFNHQIINYVKTNKRHC